MSRHFEELPQPIEACRYTRRIEDCTCPQCACGHIIAIEETHEITRDTLVHFVCPKKQDKVYTLRIAAFSREVLIIKEIEKSYQIPMPIPLTSVPKQEIDKSKRMAILRNSHHRIVRQQQHQR